MSTHPQPDHLRLHHWFWLRVGIVLLRILPIWAALMWLAALYDFGITEFVAYSPPLQKRFYVPIVFCFSSVLVLIPFILLRRSMVFRIYAVLFLGCLVFMAYDYFIPFQYVAPASDANAPNASGWLCNFWITDGRAYWTSNPRFPPSEEIGTYVPFIGTMVLAFVYRRYFLRWAANAEQGAPAGLPGPEESGIHGTPDAAPGSR